MKKKCEHKSNCEETKGLVEVRQKFNDEVVLLCPTHTKLTLKRGMVELVKDDE